MNPLLHFRNFLILLLFSASAQAGVYVEVAPSRMDINIPGAKTTHPLLIDTRLGYSHMAHQLELAFMSGVKDDSLNQLTVDVPSVVSVFYHYLPAIDSSLKLHLILGASQVTVDSSYPGIADASEDFSGVSYGIGFEESFQSLPQLKLSADWIRLYHGDDLKINNFSLGVHYEF